MSQISAACISSVMRSGSSPDNLIFAGQILPEFNSGLPGTPELLHSDGSCLTAAVFSGGAGGERRAYYAANAFRSSLETLGRGGMPDALLREIGKRLADAGEAPVSSAAVCINGLRLRLADTDGCRAYLLRAQALYLLSQGGAADGRPHGAAGALLPGDRLLLCTDSFSAPLPDPELLRLLSAEGTPAEALRRAAEQARAAGCTDSLTAVLLFVEA